MEIPMPENYKVNKFIFTDILLLIAMGYFMAVDDKVYKRNVQTLYWSRASSKRPSMAGEAVSMCSHQGTALWTAA